MIIAGRTAACAAAVAVLGTSGFSWYTVDGLEGVGRTDAITKAQRDAPKHLDKSVNILLIGLDSRKDMDGNDLPKELVQDELHAGSSEIGGYNTNSLIVLHIPPNGGKVQAVSIPRDDYVQTYGGDNKMHKIKEAYGRAKGIAESKLAGKGLSKPELERQSREAGRLATIQTVQHLLNIPIDHFAEVNLLGFYDIAKAVEPITVCLNNPVNDPIESRVTDSKGNVIKPGGGTGLKLPAGKSELKAAEALSFVRQRHHLDGGDFARTHRQQAFIASVEYKLKHDGIFGDFDKMRGLLDVVKKDLVIDDQWKILDFADQAPSLTGGNVEFNTLTFEKFDTRDGQDVNIVDPATLQRTVMQLFGHDLGPAPTASGAPAAPGAPASAAAAASAPAAPAKPTGTVDLYYAAQAAAAAPAEMTALTGMGFEKGRSAASTTHPKSTTVVYGRGAKAAAEQIAARYSVTAVQSANAPAGHIELTLGSTFTPPGAGAPAASGAPGSDQGGTPDPAATLQFQGKAVKAGDIPCVD